MDILLFFIYIPHLYPLAKAPVCGPNDTVLCVFPALGKRHLKLCFSHLQTTVEPRFNEPLFNEVVDITNDTLRPGQNYTVICME